MIEKLSTAISSSSNFPMVNSSQLIDKVNEMVDAVNGIRANLTDPRTIFYNTVDKSKGKPFDNFSDQVSLPNVKIDESVLERYINDRKEKQIIESIVKDTPVEIIDKTIRIFSTAKQEKEKKASLIKSLKERIADEFNFHIVGEEYLQARKGLLREMCIWYGNKTQDIGDDKAFAELGIEE